MEEKTNHENDTQEVELKSAPSAKSIHDLIYQEAESELARSSANLFWSGLAAGLSMGFSMIGEGLLETYLPDAEWSTLVSSFGYSVGFVIVILGKQQLFTENTLTTILPLLHNRNLKMLGVVMRLWGIVLAANLFGTLLLSLVAAHTTAFGPHVLLAFEELGRKAMEPGFGTTLLRGIFAGWLIALMVWLLPYAQTARVWVIILITYIIGIGHFSHVIAGSVEVFTYAAMGHASWWEVTAQYVFPTLIGNIIGGVVLVAALNHGQTTNEQQE